MKIALAQLKLNPGNVTKNCDKMSTLARKASDQGCEAIVFPELADTGYVPKKLHEFASTWAEGPLVKLGALSKKLGIFIFVGLSEKVKNRIYNSMAVLSPDGRLVAKYRKIHLFSHPPICEDKRITAGSSLVTTKIQDMTWGLSICYDLRFPELYRGLVAKHAHVFVISSAWPIERIEHWKALISARAIENQVYVIACNRVGTDADLTFGGSSSLVDPWGRILASADGKEETLLVHDIKKELVTQTRQALPVLQHGKLGPST